MQRRATIGGRVRVAVLVVGAVLAAAGAPAAAGPKDPSGQAFPGDLGVIAFTSDRDGGDLDVFRIDIDGTAPVNLTSNSTASDGVPAWSSEGTLIAFESTRGGSRDIWRMAATGRNPIRLTTDPALDLEPSWFPSDTKLAFRRNAAGDEAHIWTLRMDENGDPIAGSEVPLTKGTAGNIAPAVSPDGKRIAFVSNRDGDDDIYVMKAAKESATNKPVKLTKNAVDDGNPDWSPDGKRIVFESRQGEGTVFHPDLLLEIVVMNADGTGQKRLTSNRVIDRDPVWSPDGKRIAFERDGGNTYRDIFRMKADGTNLYDITESDVLFVDANPSWQPR